MQFTKAGDLNICCKMQGNGYPLVLIMGFTASMDWWEQELIDALSKNYRVLAFDNRGAGRTETPIEGDFSCEMFADDTAALMDALNIKCAHVFGFSMGGIIAQTLTLRHPDKVSKLVLGGTFCGGKETVMPAPEVTKLLIDTSGGLEGTFSRTLKLMFPGKFLETNPGFAGRFREQYMSAPVTPHNARRQLTASMKQGTYADLPGIKIPALVITGAEDVLIPPQNSHIIAERIPGSKLIEYKDAGHCFMSPKREEFLKDLLEFLEEK